MTVTVAAAMVAAAESISTATQLIFGQHFLRGEALRGLLTKSASAVVVSHYQTQLAAATSAAVVVGAAAAPATNISNTTNAKAMLGSDITGTGTSMV